MEKIKTKDYHFDVAINFPDGKHYVFVISDGSGIFQICEHGQLLGKINFNEHLVCESCSGNLDAATIEQLGDQIERHYL